MADALPRAFRLVAIAVLTIAGTAGGQTLDLSGSQSQSMPETANPSAVAQLIKTLEAESARLASDGPAEGDASVLVQTAIRVRMVAGDLLAAGDRAGVGKGTLVTLIGWRLASGRGLIDACLKRLTATDQTKFAGDAAPVLQLLRGFNERAAAFDRETGVVDDATIDGIVQRVCAPLADAVGRIEGVPARSQWVERGAVREIGAAGRLGRPDAGPVPAQPRDAPSIDALRQRVERLAPGDPMAGEISSILDFLDRGGQFTELQPRIEGYRRCVSKALDLAELLAAAGAWLGATERGQYVQRLTAAIGLFKNPEHREQGRIEIERLDRSRDMLERLDRLAGERVDIRALAAAFVDVDRAATDAADSTALARRQVSVLSNVVDRLLAYERLDKATSVPKELREVEIELQKNRRTSTKSMLAQIGTLIDKPDVLADPAFSSVLAAHRHVLADLQRLRKLGDWSKAIAAIDPPSAPLFERQMRKACRWLVQPTRRPDADAALDQFERQLGLFRELPFEAQLKSADAAAIAATGGMNDKLLAAIVETRKTWAQGWADGDAASAAGKRLLLMARLTHTMQDVAEMQRRDNDLSLIDRWAGWELDTALASRPLSDVTNRLKLATAAAVNGEDSVLKDQLDALDRDAPLVVLIGSLTRAMGSTLRELPGGAVSLMGKLTVPPEDDSWMADHRVVLAQLCRGVTECEHARRRGDVEAARRLNDYVNRLAGSLIEELQGVPRMLPAVGGFDGSDRNAKGG